MGVQGLTTLIKRYAPDSTTIVTLESCRGSVIAIDTSILLYRFRYSDDSPQSHIYGFLRRCLVYAKHGVLPIFVIDGDAPPEKGYTLNRRRQKRERVQERIKLLEASMNESNRSEILQRIKKLRKQAINVTRQHHQETQELLDNIGFNVIVGSGEAEDTCAQLQKEGKADYIYSEDTDLFPLGCSRVLRDEKMGMRSYSLVELDRLLEQMGLTHRQFVDLCVLCGCDYCPSVIGSAKAYELLVKLGSLEKVLGHLRIGNREIYLKARDLYLSQSKVPLRVSPRSVQLDERSLKRFLTKKGIKSSFTNRFIREFKKYIGLMEGCRVLAKITQNGSLSNLGLLEKLPVDTSSIQRRPTYHSTTVPGTRVSCGPTGGTLVK